MIYFATVLFTISFVLAWRYRSKRLAIERKRQVVQTWPRAVAAFPDPLPKPNQAPKDGAKKNATFRYSVRGTKYNGTYLSPAKELVTHRTNGRALRHLHSAEEWRIYYNPNDPAEAYLSPGPPRVGNIHLMVDFFFLILAPAVMIFSWHGILTHS